MPGRNNPSLSSSEKRASKAFKMLIVSFMRKHSRELNFMTFAAEIRLQITDLPLKLVILPIGSLVSIHRTPPRNPASCYLHAVSADLTTISSFGHLRLIQRQTPGSNPVSLNRNSTFNENHI
jgi:hypothetical protein